MNIAISIQIWHVCCWLSGFEWKPGLPLYPGSDLSSVHLSLPLIPTSGINILRQEQARFSNYKILKLVQREVWLIVFWKLILFYYIREPSDVADPIRRVLSRARDRQNMTFHLGTFFFHFDLLMRYKKGWYCTSLRFRTIIQWLVTHWIANTYWTGAVTLNNV